MEPALCGQERVHGTGELENAAVVGSWILAGLEPPVLGVEQFPKGGSQDRAML